MRRIIGALSVALLVVLGAPPTPAGAEEGAYAPPVPGPVIDGWRPPPNQYGPGNRGIDLAATPGEPVRAAADGEVVFAGRIGSAHHVVVLHPDGIRTTYAFLAGTNVRRGQRVVRGQQVGVAAGAVHFGARAGDDRYLDPTQLLAGRPPDVHLVPHDTSRLPEWKERRNLLDQLGDALVTTAGAAASGVDWARDRAVDAVTATAAMLEDAAALGWAYVESELADFWLVVETVVHYAMLPARVWDTWGRIRLYRRDQRRCTPAETAAPTRPATGRIAVLVAGFGSNNGGDVEDVDTDALGYADTLVFSYAGGDVATNPYTAEDSSGDLFVAAERLRDLLADIRRRRPGVTVDVIAHSQGGVVAREALAGTSRFDPRLPVVANLVTLGSPHHGADLATAGAAIATTVVGEVAGAARDLLPVDLTSTAVRQLSETSDFIEQLDDEPLPGGTRFTSIAARSDWVVPAARSADADAVNVLLPLDSLTAHAELPGHPATQREIALAVAGRRPTCRSVDLGDMGMVGGIDLVEDALLDSLVRASLYADIRTGGPARPDPTRSPGPVPSR